MDAEEARLLAEIEARRADLVSRAHELRRSVTQTLDPRERIKRHPLRGLLTSVGTGIFLGRLMSGRPAARRNSEPEAAHAAEPESPLASLAASVLPTLLPTLLPAIVGPLASFIFPRASGRRGKKNNSH